MASSINYLDIDEAFPVAGIDNETQGFRDNFSTIKNSLNAAKSEIETLQSTTAKTNASSNFSGNDIIDANLVACTGEVFVAGSPITTDQSINFNNGHYQSFQVANNITFTLSNLPTTGRYGSFRVALYSDGSSRTVNFSVVAGSIYVGTGLTLPVTVNSTTQPKIIEFFTHTGSSIVYARYLGQFTPA